MAIIIIILVGVGMFLFKKIKTEETMNQNEDKKDGRLNKTYSDLNNKYNKQLKTIKIEMYMNIICIMASIILIFFICSITGIGNTLVGVCIITILFCVLIGSIMYMISKGLKNKKEYIKEFKSKIITKLIQDVDNNLYYIDYENPTNIKPLTNEECKNSKLFSMKIPNLIEDNIVGVLEDKTIFRMCNYIPQISYRNEFMSNSESETQGLFIDIKINKDIGTFITIARKKIRTKNKSNIISIDNENFERFFDVYAEDKNIALRILTSDVMEYMVNFRKNNEYEISIVNNHIYLRFSTGPIFEPRMTMDYIKFESLDKYTKILKFVLEVSNKVKKEIENLEL